MGEYLALPDGAGNFPQDSTGPVVLRDTAEIGRLTPTGLSPSMARLSSTLRLHLPTPYGGPYNPDAAETTPVWAVPLSLATTQGIAVAFFSSGY